MKLALLLLTAVDPAENETAVRLALITSASAVVIAIITTVGVILVPWIQRRRSPQEIDGAAAADIRSEGQLELDGMKADAASARAGQASALALVEATRSHYMSLLEALERQAGNLQTTIDSLLEVNRGLTESLRVAQAEPAAHMELIESLRSELRHTHATLTREQAALTQAEASIAEYRGRVADLEHELVEATEGRNPLRSVD